MTTTKTTALRLRKIEAGVYSTPDRRFQVENIGSMGEWDSLSACWVVKQYRDAAAADNQNGHEVFEAGTKRDCVEWLAGHLQTDR
jgi:hypothetical protein